MDYEKKLNKQRRNLIASSIVLGIYDLAGLNIEVINILGNEITVTNQDYITSIIVAFWIYSFLRYFQFAANSQHLGHEAIKKNFKELMEEYSGKIIVKKARVNIKKNDKDNVGIIPNIEASFFKLRKASLFKRIHNYSAYAPVNDEKEEDMISTEFSLFEFTTPFLKTIFALTFAKTTVLEYALPYILFIITSLVLLL